MAETKSQSFRRGGYDIIAKLPETGPVLGCRQASYFTPSQWCALGKIGGMGPFLK